MNDLDFLKQLFNGYISCFGSHRWHTYMRGADLTQEEIGHFRRLALMLGYIPVREWTGDPIVNPRDLVWLTPDPTAMFFPQNPPIPSHAVGQPRVFLHLERENYDNNVVPCVCNESNKLLNSAMINDGRYLIGIFGWVTQENWKTCCHFVETNLGYRDRNVLLIGCLSLPDRPNPEYVEPIEAMVWVNNEAFYREATFGTDRGGFFHMRFSGTDWHARNRSN